MKTENESQSVVEDEKISQRLSEAPPRGERQQTQRLRLRERPTLTLPHYTTVITAELALRLSLSCVRGRALCAAQLWGSGEIVRGGGVGTGDWGGAGWRSERGGGARAARGNAFLGVETR